MKGIRDKRVELKMTQMELAKRIGATQGVVSAWEKGLTFPSAEKLPKLATILECSIDDLFRNGGEQERSHE